MNNKEIFELIDKFESSNLSSLEIKDRDFSINMEKTKGAEVGFVPRSTSVITGTMAEDAGTAAPQVPEISKEEYNNIKVKAPLVGTFYAAPSPDDAAFVTEGQKVEKGQTLCLIEAMKMMNELKSPVDGIVATIHAENEKLVEYDQILFEVTPC